MASKHCSDVVESSGGARCFRAESRRNAAFSSVRNSPGALVFRDARTSDDHSPRRTGPLYRRVRRFVKRSHRNPVSVALIIGDQLTDLETPDWVAAERRDIEGLGQKA